MGTEGLPYEGRTLEGGKVLVRLNKYISMCGVTSRRKADQLILDGKVKVNGLVVKELGWKVDPKKDVVEVNNKVIKPKPYIYLILNKPCCYLTAIGEDKKGKKTISELLKDVPTRVFPAGRLDYNAEGLLILTNDGELANRIMHPRYKLPKTYHALVSGKVSQRVLQDMKRGANLEDGFAKPDDVKIIRYEGENTLVEIIFHEGRKHIVKRFLAYFGHKVLKLKRVSIGPIRLGKLPPGKWRYLRDDEIALLKKALSM